MSDESLSNTRSIRTFNTALVLRAIHREGPSSRTQLSRSTGLSASTVSRIVGELIEMGVVFEERLGESTGGRKPIILRLAYDSLFVVGVQVHRSRVAIALSDLKGTLIRRRAYRPWALDPSLLLKELAVQINDMLHESGVHREERLLGVGIAISGVVDSTSGSMSQSINLGWRDVPIASILGSLLNLPVFVENDANAGALAEMWFGCAQGVDSYLYLLTEAGVGSGIILGQRLVTGSRGMAGEIGHIPVMRNGYRCRCGGRGCLETYVYLPDVFARYKERAGQPIDKATFFSTESNEDPVVSQLVLEAEEALALAVSFPIALLDLDQVIIGGIWGTMPGSRERIQAACQLHLERTGLSRPIVVAASALGEESDLLGAVGLVIDRYFSPPRALSGTGVQWEARSS